MNSSDSPLALLALAAALLVFLAVVAVQSSRQSAPTVVTCRPLPNGDCITCPFRASGSSLVLHC